jgi:hypothetical protein
MIDSQSILLISVALIAAVSVTVIFVFRGGNRERGSRDSLNGKFGGFFKNKARAEASRDKLFVQIWELEQKRKVIDSYASEYFNTLREAGWAEFTRILGQLEQAQETIADCLAHGEYSEALLLADYLLGALNEEGSQSDLALAREAFAPMVGLENWQKSTNEILVAVAVALQKAAVDTKSLGISRTTRKRKPTLAMVSDLVNRFHD